MTDKEKVQAYFDEILGVNTTLYEYPIDELIQSHKRQRQLVANINYNETLWQHLKRRIRQWVLKLFS